jgi:hypothetical protein
MTTGMLRAQKVSVFTSDGGPHTFYDIVVYHRYIRDGVKELHWVRDRWSYIAETEDSNIAWTPVEIIINDPILFEQVDFRTGAILQIYERSYG